MAAKKTAIKERYSKTQILSEISEDTGLTKKEVASKKSELELARERLRNVKTRVKPITNRNSVMILSEEEEEMDLLQQLLKWKQFKPGNEREEGEYQQYLVDLLQSLKKLKTSKTLPKTPSQDELNQLLDPVIASLQKVHVNLLYFFTQIWARFKFVHANAGTHVSDRWG